MSIFKCKMCGGTIEFEKGSTVGICEYCGTKQTLPKLDDDKKANLYDRANHFRRNNEYDKATNIYEQILAEDNTDAEAYWSLVLCRYGIEYVEDPTSHKRVPTVNRTQFTSIYADEDYKSAIEYADSHQKEIYELEAKQIDEIQKGILAISNKEEPFDIFICYKETDNNGRRTMDSVLANDLYHQLTQEGFKVFFSRITLEDKLGTAYEPYIFAALNSSKVMVVLGTKPEYFNAVWVKNEWSRYLSLVKESNGKKILIPAYRDMDPYDLPEEFSHLQAQDMSKLGFMQDLIRGIKKIIQTDNQPSTIKETIITNNNNTNTAPLLKRAFLFLEDGNFEEADEYCEKVLDIDPENAKAYLGKLMVDLQVEKQEYLKEQEEPFDDNGNYQKVVRFGDEKLSSTLSGYISYINERNQKERPAIIYNSALSMMNDAKVDSLEEAIKSFQSISGWKDSDEQILACQKKIEEIKAREETKRLEAEKASKKRKKIVAIVTTIICIIIGFIFVLNSIIIPNNKYSDAIKLKENGKYEDAITIFKEIESYKDSKNQITEVRLLRTKEQLKNVEVGSYIEFGSYEQDNDTSNGEEDIEWKVLDIKDGKALVISRYGLDYQSYNAEYEGVTWETCSLRSWLNETFFNSAFSSEEQSMIVDSMVTADKNSNYNTNPGNDTTDKIFLLSITEAEEYFSSDSDGICKSTEYAVAKGAYISNDSSCWWWLRSPGSSQSRAASVHSDGSIGYCGSGVGRDDRCVRPALWVNLES